MLALKVAILLFVLTGGALALPSVKRHVRKHKWLQYPAWAVAGLGAIYLFLSFFGDVESNILWVYRRITIGPYIDRDYSVSACDEKVGRECVRYGGAFGDTSSLAKMRVCADLQVIPSSTPALKWESLWITNIYSYAPGGGTPGGGLVDDVLKVGGWGDWYFSLIRFELPQRTRMTFAGVLLFVQPDEQETIPLFVDRIIEKWKWDLSEKHVWWKDRPGGFPIIPEALPPPKQKHWYVVEITKLYNQWVDGTAGNFGFQIRPATNFGSITRFASNLAEDRTKTPYLVLCAETV